MESLEFIQSAHLNNVDELDNYSLDEKSFPDIFHRRNDKNSYCLAESITELHSSAVDPSFISLYKASVLYSNKIDNQLCVSLSSTFVHNKSLPLDSNYMSSDLPKTSKEKCSSAEKVDVIFDFSCIPSSISKELSSENEVLNDDQRDSAKESPDLIVHKSQSVSFLSNTKEPDT